MRGARMLAWSIAAVALAAVPAIILLNAGAGQYQEDGSRMSSARSRFSLPLELGWWSH